MYISKLTTEHKYYHKQFKWTSLCDKYIPGYFPEISYGHKDSGSLSAWKTQLEEATGTYSVQTL